MRRGVGISGLQKQSQAKVHDMYVVSANFKKHQWLPLGIIQRGRPGSGIGSV